MAVLFSLFPTTLYAQGELDTDPGDNNNHYVYSVEIEFGSFAFYYDWGTWNVNTFSYDADASSTSPAADTVPGKAGWYSFDGVNNKIKVTNQNISITGKKVEIDIQYSTAPESFDNFPLKPGCIEMDFYDSPDFKTLLNTSGPNSYKFSMDANTSKEIYLSFSGEPVLDNGEQYMSAVARRIGYVLIGVGVVDPSDPDTGN